MLFCALGACFRVIKESLICSILWLPVANIIGKYNMYSDS